MGDPDADSTRSGQPQPDEAPASALRLLFAPPSERENLHLAEILRDETVGGTLMLVATLAALIWANLAHHSYESVIDAHLGPLTVHAWVADGLLTVFFLVAGIELKREFTEGSLRRPADALVPVLAAVGGMLLPAVIYLAVTASTGADTRGWAIPMATDIAFALAVLAIVGSELPTSLRAFLLTLAIVDDLGAIIVIAVFFSHGVHLLWLLGALAGIGLLWLLQRRRIEHPALVVVLGLLAWFLMFRSGVHATIAGVLVGLVLRFDPDDDHDPLNWWQHRLEPWSAGLVVPLFALVSAGVPVTPSALRAVVTTAVPLGIVLGLFVGKMMGITASALATARFTRADLAPGIRRADVLAVAQLAGIGFTVALLISDLAFPDDAQLTSTAKAAVLVASLLAALVGGVALRHRGHRHTELRAG